MRISQKVFVALCVMTLLLAALVSVGINAGEQPKSIRIIYTNDLLGYTEPCG
ncbi:hypothetical protein LLG46_06385 [bacterium]|nr:hypothetical protein [bacterium]